MLTTGTVLLLTDTALMSVSIRQQSCRRDDEVVELKYENR